VYRVRGFNGREDGQGTTDRKQKPSLKKKRVGGNWYFLVRKMEKVKRKAEGRGGGKEGVGGWEKGQRARGRRR